VTGAAATAPSERTGRSVKSISQRKDADLQNFQERHTVTNKLCHIIQYKVDFFLKDRYRYHHLNNQIN